LRDRDISSSIVADTDQTKYDSGNISVSSNVEINDDGSLYESNWLNFNLSCISKQFGVDIVREEFFDGKNKFFYLQVLSKFYSDFKEEEFDISIEEGLEKCPRCSGFKIFSIQVQKRSADEAMTSIFECSECKYKWEN